MKKIITAVSIAATTLVGMLALAAPAQAGEGHWSIGNGVQFHKNFNIGFMYRSGEMPLVFCRPPVPVNGTKSLRS